MSKQKSYSAGDNLVQNGSVKNSDHNGNQEPLSGSKKVKNRNHSGANQHGEGHGGV
ncbi:small acid-soluble spore protein P [Paenibacillus ferrarius]|uniref:small acid-soluble spore protein P n=1 Tax=Paenibacillus ferrarius TaxID=1469647 RepID=UPI0009A4B430|nr:small acid-soluble spore protein P [Paenibacillus ferrarius]